MQSYHGFAGATYKLHHDMNFAPIYRYSAAWIPISGRAVARPTTGIWQTQAIETQTVTNPTAMKNS